MAAGDFPGIRPLAPTRRLLSKVAEVTVYFWIIKVLTTFVGEATSDYLVHTINPYVAVGLGFVVFVVSLALQFAVRRYVPGIYWTAVAMVAVFGTMAADVLHVALGVPYIASTFFFALTLALIFVIWYRTEGTLSIHSIYTPRREVFYWAAVVTAFAFGTAAGDLTARTVGAGYLGSGLMFTALIAVPALAYWRFGLNAIASFWFAYIVTRPVGASFADWMGFPHRVGGLGLGHGPVCLVSAAIFVCFVVYLAISRKDVPPEPSGPRAQPASAGALPPAAARQPARAGRHRTSRSNGLGG
jgi:uncharacterized membrane-anchored protein